MSERIRVMRVIARMNVGGPAIQVTGLMRALDPVRFDQELLTGWCADDEADYLLTQAPDVPVTRINGLGRAIKPGDDLAAVRTLHKEIRRFRPHIIHTHTAKAGALGRPIALASRSGALLVHTYHGHLLHGYFSPAKTRALIALEKSLAKRTARIVAVGAQVRDDLLNAGIGDFDQFSIIAPGLDFPEPSSRAQAREELGLSTSAIVVSLIGRLTGIKRVDRFVNMAALLHDQLPGRELVFLIAGDGDAGPALTTMLAERDLPVIQLGWRSDISRILAATDVLTLTSDNEGTPISLIQAAMAAVPVVATNVGSVKDVVLDGVTGLLAEPTAQSLAQQVNSLITNSELRVRLGAAARQHAQGRYSVQRLAGDHADMYQQLVASRRQR